MRNCDQKPAKCYDCAEEHLWLGSVCLRYCAIFALLVSLVLCDRATARPQFGFGNQDKNPNQVPVGSPTSTGKTWSSVSLPALRTEAILQQPPSETLRQAKNFTGAMEALQSMGLDVVLTASASDDAMTPDERWEVIGNSNQTGTILNRYLKSNNAVFSVNVKGAIEIISLDEMFDERHFETIIYRVDNLANNLSEVRGLAHQIEQAVWPEVWEESGGCATIQPRIQSGHRLLIVLVHYQCHVKLRQFLYEMSVAGSGPNLAKSRSSVVAVGSTPGTLSRLVDVPEESVQAGESSRDSLSDFRQMLKQSGGAF